MGAEITRLVLLGGTQDSGKTTLISLIGCLRSVQSGSLKLLGKEVKDRKYVFAARDKMDETHDSMRAIRSKDYKLIFYYGQNYRDRGPKPTQPGWELYDMKNDPHEMNNLATDRCRTGDLLAAMNDKLNALIEAEVGEDIGQMLPGGEDAAEIEFVST